MGDLYTIIGIFITLIFIGFFAGYEIAFVSANRLGIELKKKQGKPIKKGTHTSLKCGQCKGCQSGHGGQGQ